MIDSKIGKGQVLVLFCFCYSTVSAQLKWKNVDAVYQPLPSSIHVFTTHDSLDGKPNIAYYVIADLKDKNLAFTVDTTFQRRMTPSKYFKKNNNPYVVVNTTFFSFATNQNLNMVIKDGKLVSYNIQSIQSKSDSTLFYHPFGSAIGISSTGDADIAWVYTDTSIANAYATQTPKKTLTNHNRQLSLPTAMQYFFGTKNRTYEEQLNTSRWNQETAVGGGPVLLQDGAIKITNNEEMKFTGNGLTMKHPRTAMGYTKDHHLIILVIEGRNKGKAEGASLLQEAQILKDLGCIEALNLDGGGSSCMLVNGKETIQVSDIFGQRPVPCVFIIQKK
ncbi:MAG TPA: phosphodiester glycosidase family protein [Chitinophagaceae bacterium]|nr:phosphodiester glycosidase family protein [Chitinophagaceae bacterium]HQV05618.1 phosphodiester glycosidase family protein [Chitinophagaceae bacterium]